MGKLFIRKDGLLVEGILNLHWELILIMIQRIIMFRHLVILWKWLKRIKEEVEAKREVEVEEDRQWLMSQG